MSPGIRIRVVSGPEAGRVLDVPGELVVGREGPGLPIADPELSRRHVTVRPAAGGLIVEDQGSTNGTFVAGERITGPVTLGDGDSFSVGGTEIAVEVVGAGATRLHDAPDPGATKLSTAPAPSAPAPGGALSPVARRTRPRAAIAAAGLGVLTIVLIALLAGSDEEVRSRVLRAPATVTALTSEPTRTIFAGTVGGSPIDVGNASFEIVRSRSLRGVGSSPVSISGKVILRADAGSASGTFSGTIMPQADSSLRYEGSGTLTGGTGDLDAAKGRFTLTGTQAGGSPKASFVLRGTIQY